MLDNRIGAGYVHERFVQTRKRSSRRIPDFFPAHLAEVFAVQFHVDSFPETVSRCVFMVGFRGNAKGRWDLEPALCHPRQRKPLAPDRVTLVLVNLVKKDRPSHAVTCTSITS